MELSKVTRLSGPRSRSLIQMSPTGSPWIATARRDPSGERLNPPLKPGVYDQAESMSVA